MADWVYEIMRQGGYAGVVFLMALENIVPPIPSEVVMGFGGIAVSRGHMSFLPLLVWGTVGATLGNYALFYAADRLGYERLGPVIERWGRWLTLEWEDVEQSGRFLRRHGHWVVLFLRCAPMFRTVVSIPAGLAHMGHIKFLVFTAVGTAVWNTALILAGQWAGRQFQTAETWLGWMTIGLIVIGIGWYAWRVATWKPRSQS